MTGNEFTSVVPLSPLLLEASNGTLTALMLFVLVFHVPLLFDLARRSGWNISAMYRDPDTKAAIALMTIWFAFLLRVFVIWVARHWTNQARPLPFSKETMDGVLMFSTIVAVIGVLCWMRVTSPSGIPNFLWWFLAALALAFGFGSAVL